MPEYQDSQSDGPENTGMTEEQWQMWGKMCLNMAHRGGIAFTECSICPKCRRINYHLHRFAEALSCLYTDCRTRYPSAIARPPAAGETLADHFTQAIDALGVGAIKEQQKNLPPITAEELASLPEDVTILLSRLVQQTALGTLVKVRALAEFLAENGAT